MFDPNTGQNLDRDVSLAYPWSQDIIRRVSKENGHAAATREEKKRKKKIRRACSRRYVSRCVPLVKNIMGGGAQKQSIFLQHLSQQSAILMFPCSCHIGENDFLQFCKDVMPKLFLENF